MPQARERGAIVQQPRESRDTLGSPRQLGMLPTSLKRRCPMPRTKLVPLAALLAGWFPAYAQSGLTLYGTLDLGLWHQSKAAGVSGSNAGRATTLQTGGTAPSVFGVRGGELLGDGWKAVFNLETHLDPSIGSSGLGTFWSRSAYVGLSSPWGIVKFGQQINPAVLGYAATDPRGLRESLSGVIPWAMASAQNVGPGTASPNNTLAFFASNSISYEATLGATSYGLLYALGEGVGSSRADRVVAGQVTIRARSPSRPPTTDRTGLRRERRRTRRPASAPARPGAVSASRPTIWQRRHSTALVRRPATGGCSGWEATIGSATTSC